MFLVQYSKRGGGVALLYKLGLTVNPCDIEPSPKLFESLHVDITSATASISLVLLYRPQNKSTGCPFHVFLEEFSAVTDYYLLKHLPLVITGDFNIHVDNDTDTNAVAFNNLLSACGLTQHINSSTHKCGHTLDLFITRSV